MVWKALKFWLLKLAVARRSDVPVPRSGDKGRQVNAYAVRLVPSSDFCAREVLPEEDARLLVDDINSRTLSCWAWRSSNDRFLVDVSVDEALTWPAEITHWKGLITFSFKGWGEFAFHHFLRVDYIHARLRLISQAIGKFVFNRRKLVAADRVEVLRAVLDLQLAGRDAPNATGIMTALYSIAWFTHPQATAQQRHLQFYLDSLVDTRELARAGIGHMITGRGIAAIELFEEQERKHSEALSTQKKMVWLTVLLAILALLQAAAAILQAGVVKLPTFRDWRDPAVIERERGGSAVVPQSPDCGTK